MSKVGHKGKRCLIWPYARDDKGYGQVYTGGLPRLRKAHRLMCEIVNGPASSPKMCASHTCGKGHLGCFHPDHLEWDTHRGNQLARRGHGTKNHPIKLLSPARKKEILRVCLSITVKEATVRFGIKRGSVDYWRRKAKQAA